MFTFVSEGPNGRIKKMVKFSTTYLKGFYNLGFGDAISGTENIDDLVISNNGDSEKVLATVMAAVYAFTEKYPNSYVYATESTPARTRLYRIGISKFYDDASETFDIFGLIEQDWIPFEQGINYEGFLIRRKYLDYE